MAIEFNQDGSIKLPESIQKSKTEKNRIENQKLFLEEYSLEHDIDFVKFFKNKKYLGRIESKRNIYHAFYNEQIYLLMTGLKSKSNINVLFEDEIKEINSVLERYPKNHFTIYELMDFLKLCECNLKRLKFYVEDYKKYSGNDEDSRRYLYSFILEACYILSIKGDLKIDSDAGRQLIFYKKEAICDKNNPILDNLEFLAKTEDFILLKDDRFYYTFKYKNLRGNIFPYLISEIDYLHKLILDSKEELMNIDYLVKTMNYQKRFIEIYNMIIEQNLKNEREEHAYFQSRIKAALQIIKFLYGDIEIEKVGRSYEYRRKN
jgi:hypothetical protein